MKGFPLSRKLEQMHVPQSHQHCLIYIATPLVRMNSSAARLRLLEMTTCKQVLVLCLLLLFLVHASDRKLDDMEPKW